MLALPSRSLMSSSSIRFFSSSSPSSHREAACTSAVSALEPAVRIDSFAPSNLLHEIGGRMKNV